MIYSQDVFPGRSHEDVAEVYNKDGRRLLVASAHLQATQLQKMCHEVPLNKKKHIIS